MEKIYATYSEEPHVKTPVSGVVKKHLKGEIEFKNVSYRADDEDIVMDVNFKVKTGADRRHHWFLPELENQRS